jgi:hypothetical protein
MLFAIAGTDRDDCRRMLERYFAQVKHPTGSVAEGAFRLKDLYHGEMDLVWNGSRIWGVMGAADPDLRGRYVRLIEGGGK